MIECLLAGNISEDFKSKIVEQKEEKSYKIFHLFTKKLIESDRLVVRKCRREMLMKMRTIYGGRFHHNFNYSRFHNHFLFHHHHGNETNEDNHGTFNSSSSHLFQSAPLQSLHDEFNSTHSNSSDSANSQMLHPNCSHAQSSTNSEMQNSNSTQAQPSGRHLINIL